MPESVVRNIMYQVIQGLSFMHKHGESFNCILFVSAMCKMFPADNLCLHFLWACNIVVFVLRLVCNKCRCGNLISSVMPLVISAYITRW